MKKIIWIIADLLTIYCFSFTVFAEEIITISSIKIEPTTIPEKSESIPITVLEEIKIVAAPERVKPFKIEPSKIVTRKKNYGQKVIAITIDDCYNISLLKEAVEIADKENAKITFFPTGKAMLMAPGLWKKIYENGHEIELHTQTHARLSKLSNKEATKELTRT